MARFPNRQQAGRELAAQLSKFQDERPLVLAVLNGGLPTALAVASALKADLLPVPMRSLRVPWQQATIFGYVTHEGTLHLNQPLVGQVRLQLVTIQRMARKERLALEADLESWGVVIPNTLQNRTVLVVDDGMHSGWTMFSAIETARGLGAARIVAAVPVSHFRAKRFVGKHCDEAISLLTEDIALYQIGNYYDSFARVSSDDAGALLKTATSSHPSAA